MNLLTAARRDQLLASGRSQRRAIGAPLDFEPIVKHFTRSFVAGKLISEYSEVARRHTRIII